MVLRSALLAVLLCALLGGCQSDDDRPPPKPASAAAKESAEEPEIVEETQRVKVPDVTGMDGREAVDAIEAEGLHASHDEADPAGCIVEDQGVTGEVEADSEVILTLECRQRDWENRDGRDWALFSSSFRRGADKGCGVLFSFSPTGALYDTAGREYRADDCRRATDDDPGVADVEVPAKAPDHPEALGLSLGLVHGCNALFDAERIFVLSYGNERFTGATCVGALEVTRQPSPSRRPEPLRPGRR